MKRKNAIFPEYSRLLKEFVSTFLVGIQKSLGILTNYELPYISVTVKRYWIAIKITLYK